MNRTFPTLIAASAMLIGFTVTSPANAASNGASKPGRAPISCSAATNHGEYVASQPKAKRAAAAKSDCGKPTTTTSTTTTTATTITKAPGSPATGTAMVPSTKSQCKNNGWKRLINTKKSAFKNQGDCVSFVASQ